MFESFNFNSTEAEAQMRELDAKARWLLAVSIMRESDLPIANDSTSKGQTRR